VIAADNNRTNLFFFGHCPFTDAAEKR
jgi:hypothetical protein